MTTTTTPTTSFITDFLTWRKTQIKTSYESSSKVDVTTLTAEKFMALTTYKDVTDSTTNTTTKEDAVKTEADTYLMNVILYHLEDKGLKALSVSKPTLTADILATFSDTGYSADLTKYAKLWLLSSINQQKKDKKQDNIIKGEAVNKDFKEMQSGKTVTNVNMRLTFIATAKKCVDFLPYMYNSDTMITKVQDYLLTDTYKSTWVEALYDQVKDKLSEKTTAFNDNNKFAELKSKLDVLDPSFNLSCKVINEYYSTLFALIGKSSLKGNPKIQKLFNQVTKDTLQKIAAKSDHPWYELVGKTKDLFQGKYATMAAHFGRTLFKMNFKKKFKTTSLDAKSVLTLDSTKFLALIQKKYDSVDFKKVWTDSNMHKLASGLSLLCNTAAIYSGFQSYNQQTTTEMILTWVNTVASGVDVTTSIVEAANSGFNAYLWVGKKISTLMTPKDAVVRAASASTNTSKFAKFFKIGSIVKYVSAVMVVVSMAYTVYDIVTSIQNQDWGMLALSVVEFTLEFGLLILTFMTATAWSGPVSLILTAALIVVGLVKMFWEQIKQFFVDIGKFFDTLISGDLTNAFIRSTEATYHLTIEEEKAQMLATLDAYEAAHPEETRKIEEMRKNIEAI
ncbi:hypothetical protein PPL_06407 [Heterostelium album PN500]|uniref:Uncharacterized protein n=1 Tax=Heterostelium pallidum (strain ATCC 26659 / Pp 5 / PN500) TaxID=670386 RepID=D3BD27_HETP5|nr:hypothetical protein PPL_06407 [Heterostelium album PN500]EFA80819.1 hypothetical protein PPL_06407 [Heterostelium album PN500]|eukprot:XP_020432938.1 hypothetical protein PPL_06407 [Heterostelium album PN500]